MKPKEEIGSFLAAVVFYTAIPLPPTGRVYFQRIARWAPIVGLLLGALLSLGDAVLEWWGMPVLARSGAIAAAWVGLTGGLHLDGVADAADGAAASDPQRRLAVMADSVTGAFGVMAVAVVLLLKTTALADLAAGRWLALMAAAGWGRWGQVAAIAFYPYLKPTGKGAFHKQQIHLPQDLLWGLIPLLALSVLTGFLLPAGGPVGAALGVSGAAIALLVGFWFYRRFGGQTGDTYGAVVEWTEALLLWGCCGFLQG